MKKSDISVIDKYSISFNKLRWNEEERFLVKCLGINVSGDYELVSVDLRQINKRSLLYFIKFCFPQFALSPAYAIPRKKIYIRLKEIYASIHMDFVKNYYPRASFPEGKDLFKHQKTTLIESIHKKYNLWALDMGLGKTLTGATLSRITGAKRTIIICPTLVKWNWFEDMTRSWGYNPLYWSIIDAKKSKTIKAFEERFVVLNFEQVQKNMDYLTRDVVSHIIIDECQAIKNTTSQKSKAVAELIKKSNDPRITLLSGTPITNRLNDMFAYLKICAHPLGKNKSAFEERYTIKVGARGGRIVGSKNVDELRGRLSNLMIRLRAEDCLDLPKMIINNYFFEQGELSGEYQNELNNLKEKKALYDELHGVEKQKMNHEIKNNIHTLNRLVSTSKVDNVKALIDSLIDQGEKVVVFSGYKDPINALEFMYEKSCVKIDGGVPAHKRQLLINKFIDDTSCKVFLGNMKAAGIGINLVNASHVIMMNFPFTPDQIEQAQKRLHRPGQKNTVNVYYTIAKGTIDEHILNLMGGKAEDINALIDGDSDTSISYGSLPMMLFKKLLEK
jgi:SNF2 family DNA or RNA helicase